VQEIIAGTSHGLSEKIHKVIPEGEEFGHRSPVPGHTVIKKEEII
jgi:hypothetical protein